MPSHRFRHIVGMEGAFLAANLSKHRPTDAVPLSGRNSLCVSDPLALKATATGSPQEPLALPAPLQLPVLPELPAPLQLPAHLARLRPLAHPAPLRPPAPPALRLASSLSGVRSAVCCRESAAERRVAFAQHILLACEPLPSSLSGKGSRHVRGGRANPGGGCEGKRRTMAGERFEGQAAARTRGRGGATSPGFFSRCAQEVGALQWEHR